ncbi:MAG: hypothetical protein QNJ70_17855 [Xenococcaceae cyanobacterium MO_207.B15]|nr:hypothetical protein [Xenococcaceae cyanobacterium MO_207.B15]
MKIKSLVSLGAVSVGAVSILASATAAHAAALEGRFSIAPFNENGQDAGVNFIGTGITFSDGDPLTEFDFVPSVDVVDNGMGGFELPGGGTTGAIIELNATPLNPLNPDTSPNDFSAFVSDIGTIQDLGLDELLDINNNGNPLADFIVIDDAFSFELAFVEEPEYTNTGSGTTVSVGVRGTVTNLFDGSFDESFGVGTFSVDFAGLNPNQVRGLFDEPGELSEALSPTSYSANFVVREAVPESSNVLGLLALGLGGIAFIANNKRR